MHIYIYIHVHVYIYRQGQWNESRLSSLASGTLGCSAVLRHYVQWELQGVTPVTTTVPTLPHPTDSHVPMTHPASSIQSSMRSSSSLSTTTTSGGQVCRQGGFASTQQGERGKAQWRKVPREPDTPAPRHFLSACQDSFMDGILLQAEVRGSRFCQSNSMNCLS